MYHFFRQLWLVLGVKLMEINSNWFSRWVVFHVATKHFGLFIAVGPPVAEHPLYSFVISAALS